MSDKFDEYTDVLNRLVAEAVACTPQEWSSGILGIECDGFRINYKLNNEEEPGKAVISEKLRDLIDEFYVRMAQHGEAWLEAEITFHLDGEKVQFETSFKYQPHNSIPEAEVRKPWWKVW